MANEQQRFIVVAYPIDGHIRAVMNPIQWRQERRGLREVPGQRGPIEHVTIVLNTIDTMRCRHNRPEVFLPFKSFQCLQSHSQTCSIFSKVRGYWDFTGPAGQRVFNRLLMAPAY